MRSGGLGTRDLHSLKVWCPSADTFSLLPILSLNLISSRKPVWMLLVQRPFQTNPPSKDL